MSLFGELNGENNEFRSNFLMCSTSTADYFYDKAKDAKE